MALAEKSPPELDTPLAHRRPGSPLAGCFPAEPAAVSPGSGISSEFDDRNQPLDIGVMPSKIHCGIVPRFLRQAASATTKPMNPLSWVAGEARSKYERRFQKFERLLHEARRIQHDMLFGRLRRCRDTQFGRDHGFVEINSLTDYRRRVPISRNDYFAPYINAVARGEFAALFPPEARVERFTITTGTTGAPKLNPVTRPWLTEKGTGREMSSPPSPSPSSACP